MPLEEQQKQWLSDTLGVAVSGGGGGFDPVPLWQSARQAAGVQMAALARALDAYDDELAELIASYPTDTLLERIEAPVLQAFKVIAAAAPDVAVAAIAAQRNALGKNAIVDLFDNNPFGVRMSIGAVLGAALGEIETRLRGQSQPAGGH